MIRKNIWLIVFLCLWAVPAQAQAPPPDLTGRWQGSMVMHVEGKGFLNPKQQVVWTISDQKGRIFTGRIEWNDPMDGSKHSEGFSGIISEDDTRVYVAEHDEGFTFGDLTDGDRLVMYYLESGIHAKVIYTQLERIKSKR